MRKLRVVEFVYHIGFGGTEKAMYTFCKYLDKNRFDVFVCTLGFDEKSGRKKSIEGLGINVHVVARRSRLELENYFKSVKPDILHIHRSGQTEKGVIPAAKNVGIPIIIEHNIFGMVDTSDENDLIDCHIFISYSCAWRYQMLVRHPLISNKYEVLYYPLEIGMFDKFGFDNRDFTKKAIGRIGRDDNKKWEFNFIEALPAITNAFPDLEFHVIGMTPEILSKIRSMGCEKTLVLHPMSTNDTDIISFYSNFSVSTHFAEKGETFGLVLAEAMAAKLPVVTHYTFDKIHFEDSAQSELINHGYNGYVAINADMYASAVITLLSSPNIAKEMGANGYKKSRACYEAGMITRGLEQIFVNQAMFKGIVA